ncbi:MAG: xylan 1,4-beta-xylosidase [Oscillospiraceae bacterium]|nr:xylan 1,4-beta-xylosidase [Oscillospiraceae bacterium]
MEKRFRTELVESGFAKNISIIHDTETGIDYLMVREGYGLGLTPLLGSDGKPVVRKTETDSEN